MSHSGNKFSINEYVELLPDTYKVNDGRMTEDEGIQLLATDRLS